MSTLLDRIAQLERRLAALEAASQQGVLGTDQTIKACHDRLDTLLGAGGTGGVIRRTSLVVSKALSDGVATSVCRITTLDEAGSNDGGSYAVFVRGVVANGGSATSQSSARDVQATWSRSITQIQDGGNSTVAQTLGASARPNPYRDIGSVTVSVVETSELQCDIQVTAVHTGSLTAALSCTLEIIVVWNGFLSAPVLSVL